MQYLSAYRARFDAGHRYTVDITWEREGSPSGDGEAWQKAVVQIDSLAAELRNRDLPKMLGPHHPSAFGIAAFFMERLRLNVPVTEVRVHESDGPTACIVHDTDY